MLVLVLLEMSLISFDENSLDERTLKFLILDLYKLPDVSEDYRIFM